MKRIYTVLFYVSLAFAIDLAMTEKIAAQDAASQAAAIQAQAAQPEQQSVIVPPAAAKAPVVVAVPEPAAPPSWVADLLSQVSKFPIIGPYISKALLWLGILAAILTTLAAAALSILSTLKGGLNAAGLDKAVVAIQAFRDSKFMYWLLYFSNFNAKKPSA